MAQQAKKDGGNNALIYIDACIGIGEAELALDRPGKAISSFLAVLDEGKVNRKDAAVCHLHLSHAYLMDNQPSKAMDHFNLWQSQKGGLDNAFIADLGIRVGKMLSQKFQKFERTREDIERDGRANTHLDKLRRWLAETAIALDHDDRHKAAKRLDIDTATVALWLKKP